MCLKISDPKDYKAALYIRLSKEDDSGKESESVSNQKSILQTFAEKQHLEVYDIYIDDGFSGTDFNRPSFQRLIRDIEDKKVNMVISKDMSRLGRDYIQTGYYLEKYFPEKRVRYISLLDNIDTGSESSMNDITPFKAIMNDMYAKDISKKIKSVKEDKRKKGLFIGGKAPYGYKKSPGEKNRIVIDEKTADVVRKMFSLALEGKSGREIAQILTLDNVLTPSGYAGLNIPGTSVYSNVWKSEVVTFMLKNQVYIGSMVQGRVRKINYKSKKIIKLPREQWTIVQDTHEPIIDREVFDRVQIMLEKKKNTRTRTYDYLLRGLIYCRECGYKMAVMSRRLSGNKEVLYLLCRTYQRFTGYKKCTCHNIKVDTVTEAVLNKTKEVCKRYFDIREMYDILEQEYKKAKRKKHAEDTVEAVASRIGNLTGKLDKIYADKLSGILSESDFIRIYRCVEEERAQLQEKLAALKKEAPEDEKESGVSFKELAGKFLNTAKTNKELIFSLINRVEITKDQEVLIYFSFQRPKHLS